MSNNTNHPLTASRSRVHVTTMTHHSLRPLLHVLPETLLHSHCCCLFACGVEGGPIRARKIRKVRQGRRRNCRKQEEYIAPAVPPARPPSHLRILLAASTQLINRHTDEPQHAATSAMNDDGRVLEGGTRKVKGCTVLDNKNSFRQLTTHTQHQHTGSAPQHTGSAPQHLLCPPSALLSTAHHLIPTTSPSICHR